MREISLQTDSADPQDLGFGKVRLDPDSMTALGVHPGDLVYLTGKTKTAAKVWRAAKEDWGSHKLRIDKYIRANAGVNVGDTVTVEPVDTVVPAAELVLIPPKDISDNYLEKDFFNFDRLINLPVTVNDLIAVSSVLPIAGGIAECKVKCIVPETACIVGESTQIRFAAEKEEFEGAEKISYEDIGGLKAELAQVREMIELPIRHPELFRTLGVEAPRGVLLYGPPGTGKTLIAKAVASETSAHFYTIAGPEIVSKFYGESEEQLRELFEDARESAPSIIFIDELDSIAPRREDVTGEVERRIVAQLLTMLDGIDDRGQVIVIGATNRPDAIDPALRRPGRFDREIEIGVPGESDRVEILKIHTRNMPLEGAARLHSVKKPTEKTQKTYADRCDKLLTRLGRVTRGFTGADLASLVREAGLSALRRQVSLESIGNDPIPAETLQKLEVTMADFTSALQEVSPSALREIAVETGNVHWKDIGGYTDVLRDIRESVLLPITDKSRFTALGIRPPKGILLYGPPGTGKTLIAKAAATESGANFIAVKGPELLSKWVGESEKAVREIFRKARQTAPTIIFFDEIDALTANRGMSSSSEVSANVVNQLLSEMDGIEELNNVIIMAASNRPDLIDSALLRNGRFDRLIYIGEPSAAERKSILEVVTKPMPLSVKNRTQFLSGIAKETEGFTGADLSALARESAILALRDGRSEVTEDDFRTALPEIHPTMNPKVREYYGAIRAEFKGGLPKNIQNLPEYQ